MDKLISDDTWLWDNLLSAMKKSETCNAYYLGFPRRTQMVTTGSPYVVSRQGGVQKVAMTLNEMGKYSFMLRVLKH